jgi:eukaryotic-like serine/threonine-protein kinase
MAMELLRGASLHQVRAKVGLRGIPVRFAVRVLATVLDGLHHAHERGVVHRDVSAQNVFLGWDGSVKLIDFGVAKSDGPRQSTQVGIVKGSVPYLSPDHLEPKTIDRRADVFSVGVLLRELLTGTRMWDDADDLTILKRLVAKDLPLWPMTEGGLAIPPGLRRIAERALATRREDRFATAAEMRDALLHFLAATDAKGSLAEIGAWLGKVLATEQASFEAFVENARRPVPPPLPAERWLPSSELVTRLFSRPPPPPRPRPRPHQRPLPLPRVRPRARPPLRTRLPIVALVASIFAGLAIGAYFGNETVDAMQNPTEEKAE